MDTEEYLEIAPSSTEPKRHIKHIIDTGLLKDNPIRKKNPYKQQTSSDSTVPSQPSNIRDPEQVSENIKIVPSNEELKNNLVRPKPDFNKPEMVVTQDFISEKKVEDHDNAHKEFFPKVNKESSQPGFPFNINPQDKTGNVEGIHSKMPSSTEMPFKSPFSIGENKGSSQPIGPFKTQGQSQGPIPSPFPQQTGIPSNNSKPSFQLGPKGLNDLQNKPKEDTPAMRQATFISPPALKPQTGENIEKLEVSSKPGTFFPNASGKIGQGLPVPSFPGMKSSEEPKNPFPSNQPSSSTKTFVPKLTPSESKNPFPNPQNPSNSQFQGPKPFPALNNPPGFQFGPTKTPETIENTFKTQSKPPEIFPSKNPSAEKIFSVPQNPFPGQNQQPKPGLFQSSTMPIPFGTVKTQEINEKLTPEPIDKPEESLPKTTPKEIPGSSPFISQPPLKNPSFPFTQSNQSGLPFGKSNPQNTKASVNLFPNKPSEETQPKPIPKDPSAQGPIPFSLPQNFKTAPPSNIIPSFPSQTAQTPNSNPSFPFKPVFKVDPNQKPSSETNKPFEGQIPKDSSQENKDFLNKNQKPFSVLPQGFKPNTSTEPVLPMKNPEGLVKVSPGDDRAGGKEPLNTLIEENKGSGMKMNIPLNLGVKNEDVSRGASGFTLQEGKSTKINEDISPGVSKPLEKESTNVCIENPASKEIKDPTTKSQNPFGLQPQPFKVSGGFGPGLAPSNIFGPGKGPEPNQKPFPSFVKPPGADSSNILPNENPFGSKPQNNSTKLPLNPTAQTFKPVPDFPPFSSANKSTESNQTPFLDTKKSPFPGFIKPNLKENPITETPAEILIKATPKENPVIETPKENPGVKPPNMPINSPFQAFKPVIVPKDSSSSTVEPSKKLEPNQASIPETIDPSKPGSLKTGIKESPFAQAPNNPIKVPILFNTQTKTVEQIPNFGANPFNNTLNSVPNLKPSVDEIAKPFIKGSSFAQTPKDNLSKAQFSFNQPLMTGNKTASPFTPINNPESSEKPLLVPNQKSPVDESAKPLIKGSPSVQEPKDNSSKTPSNFNQPLTTGTKPINPFIPTSKSESSQKPLLNPSNPSELVFTKDKSAETSEQPKFEPKDNFPKINPLIAMQPQFPNPKTEPEPVSNSKNFAFKSTPPQDAKQGQFPVFTKRNNEESSKTQPTEKLPGPQFVPILQSKPESKPSIPEPLKPQFKPFIPQPDQSSKELSQIPSSEPSKIIEPSKKTSEEGVLKISNLEQPIKPLISENPINKLDQVPLPNPQNIIPQNSNSNFKPPVSLTSQFQSVPVSPQIPKFIPQLRPLNPQGPQLNISPTPLQNLQKPPQDPTSNPSPELPSNEKPTPESRQYAKSISNSEASSKLTHINCSNLAANAQYIVPIAIPSIKKLPKKINQDSIPDKLQFINLLLTIISPEKSSHVKDQIFAVCPNIKHEYPDIYDLITKKLNNLCICNLCQVGQTDFELNCSHKLCGLCARTKLMNLNSESSIPTLACPLCYNALSYQSLERIFPKSQCSFRYDLEARLVKEALEYADVQCKKCKKSRSSDMFVSESCMHMCKECIATSIRWQVFSCEFCDCPFQALENLRQNTIPCDGCGHQVYYIGDYVKKLSDGHSLCSECLRITLLTTKCQQCSKTLTHQELIEIDTFLYDHCAKCGIEYGIGNFKILRCCKNYICDDCFNKLGLCSLCSNQI